MQLTMIDLMIALKKLPPFRERILSFAAGAALAWVAYGFLVPL
jgi:hypothetical protein